MIKIHSVNREKGEEEGRREKRERDI